MPWKYMKIIIFHTTLTRALRMNGKRTLFLLDNAPNYLVGCVIQKSTCTRSKPHPHNACDQVPNHRKLNMEVGPAHCLLTFHAFLWFWIFPPILVAEEWWNYQRIDYLVLVRMHCNLKKIFQLVIVVVVTGIDLKKNT